MCFYFQFSNSLFLIGCDSLLALRLKNEYKEFQFLASLAKGNHSLYISRLSTNLVIVSK